MSTLDRVKVRQYCLGKKMVCVDDILLAQNIIPKSDVRIKVAEWVKQLGFYYFGRKRIDGNIRAVWRRDDRVSLAELEVVRLEMLDKRQSRDIKTIKELIKIGYSKEQALTYIKMLYNSDIEQIDVVADEEREAEGFAAKIEAAINTSYTVSQMFQACSFIFYIEKYFPGLMSANLYKQKMRTVYVSLQYDKTATEEKLEWLALKSYPHFLDLLTKIPDEGDFGELKKYMVKTFLLQETIDKLFPDEIDYVMLAAICALARNLHSGTEVKKPYGLSDDQYELSLKHLRKLHEEYG